jgi:hypothetical protein
VVEALGGGLLPIPCCSGSTWAVLGRFRERLCRLLATHSASAQSAAQARLGTTEADLRPVDSSPPNSASLPRRAFRRLYPREEPYAVSEQLEGELSPETRERRMRRLKSRRSRPALRRGARNHWLAFPIPTPLALCSCYRRLRSKRVQIWKEVTGARALREAAGVASA